MVDIGVFEGNDIARLAFGGHFLIRQRGTADQIAALNKSISVGDITWHGKAFNEFVEMLPADLFSWSLSLGRTLDSAYQKPAKIAVSSKDVPGVPRASVHLLAYSRFFHRVITLCASLLPTRYMVQSFRFSLLKDSKVDHYQLT